jgi:hypothetical protein
MSSDEPPDDRSGVSPEEIWSDLDEVGRERTLRLLVELALRLFSEEVHAAKEEADDCTDDSPDPSSAP